MAAPKDRRAAERELKGKGFKKLSGRGKGSHEVWQDDNGTSVTVPNHGKEIAAGTWRSIAKAAGLKKSRPVREPDVDQAQRLANDGVARPGSGQATAQPGPQGQQTGQAAGKKSERNSGIGSRG